VLIKAADDRRPDLDALAALLSRPGVDTETRARIDGELKRLRSGLHGERDAAYEIDFHYRGQDNVMVIHDLRIEFDGRSAQIDHLILNRALDIWVCESKSFVEGVKINEYGEWYRYYGGRTYGLPSPAAQNQRHVDVLRDVFGKGAIRLPKRVVTLKPRLVSVVLVSNSAKIDRPRGRKVSSVERLDSVFKVEQLVRMIDKDIDRRNPIALLAKIVSQDSVRDIAEQLVRLHVVSQVDWSARFGLPAEAPIEDTAPSTPTPAATGRVCASCGRTVTPKVAGYSLAHPDRFGGVVLCFDCQRSRPRHR
jgi:hypothetical protein